MTTLATEDIIDAFLRNAPDAWKEHRGLLEVETVERNTWEVYCSKRSVGNVLRHGDRTYVAYTKYPHELKLHCTCHLCN